MLRQPNRIVWPSIGLWPKEDPHQIRLLELTSQVSPFWLPLCNLLVSVCVSPEAPGEDPFRTEQGERSPTERRPKSPDKTLRSTEKSPKSPKSVARDEARDEAFGPWPMAPKFGWTKFAFCDPRCWLSTDLSLPVTCIFAREVV